MVEVIHMRNSLDTFTIRIRRKDKCERYGCKGGALKITGIAEENEKSYKVIACCGMCGAIYAFCRINRRYVE